MACTQKVHPAAPRHEWVIRSIRGRFYDSPGDDRAALLTERCWANTCVGMKYTRICCLKSWIKILKLNS